MRESLTILASLLVAALTLALVGPWFVDWTARRAFIETQLSRVLGAPVVTRGAISLVLLPTPRLELGGVSMGEGGPVSVRTGPVRFELAVTALLHGDLRFLDATVEEPQARVVLDSAGALPAIPLVGSMRDIQVERIDIRGGTLTLVDPTSQALTVAGLDLQAEAVSLTGPFRGAGSFAHEGERVGFRFSTGAREGDRLRLKIVSDEASGLPRVDADGALMLGGSLGFEGPVILSGARAFPWRAVGVASLDAYRFALEPVELRLGADTAPITASGAVKFLLGPGAEGEITLSARQIDLNKVLAEKGSSAGLEQVLRQLLADPAALGATSAPLRVALTSPATYLGGETIADLAIEARLAPGAPMHLQASGAGPGRARIALNGQIETGSAAAFRGQASAQARDLARLGDWLAPALPQLAGALRAAPIRSLEADGAIDVSAAGFAARSLRLKADRSVFSGTVAFARPLDGERARLFADLSSDALDLDGVPDLSWAGAGLAEADIALSLDARAIRVARFGEGVIDAGRIRVKLAQDGAGLHLETLSIAGLGGADVNASGDIGVSDGVLDVRVEAQRLVDLAAFARKVAPGPLADGLAARAVALSPLRLALNLRAQRSAPAEPLRLASLALDASARGSRWQASLKPEGGANGVLGQLSGQVSAETRDASMLIRQLGVETLPITGAGGAMLAASVAGAPGGGYSVDASGLLAGLDLGFQGKVSGSLGAPRATGSLRLKTADGAPLLRIIGYGPPDVTQVLPAQASAALDLADGRLALSGLSGLAAGVSLNGEIAAQLGPGRPKFSGALALDRLNLPALATLLLGAPAPVRAGAIWGEGRFGPGLAELPDVDVLLKSGQAMILDGVPATQASLRLTLSPGAMGFSDLTAALGPGRIEGRASLRRDGALASLMGAVAVTGSPIPGTWVKGVWDGRMEFTTTGDSPAALAAGLAGSGAFQLASVMIAQADPAAPGRVVAEAEAGKLYVSENDFMGALRRELEKAPLPIATRDLAARVSGGVAYLTAPDIGASIDLRRMAVEARVELPVGDLPKNWNERPPRVAVVWRGPLAAPQRDLDAGTFINGLAVRAIARETARIEALEADLRERAFFARRKRGLDFLHRREAEVAAFLTEQARLDRERQEREKGEIGRLIESLPTDALQPEPLRRPADLDLTTPAGAGR